MKRIVQGVLLFGVIWFLAFTAAPRVVIAANLNFCTNAYSVNQCLGQIFTVSGSPNYCTTQFSVNQCLNQIFGGVSGAFRTRAQGPMAFYVNASTSPATCNIAGVTTTNGCGGGSNSVTPVQARNPLTPFLTTQAALQAIIDYYDFAGFQPTIVQAWGTSTNYGGITVCRSRGPNIGRPAVVVTGDPNNPTSVHAVAPNGAWVADIKDGCFLAFNSEQIDDQGSALGAFHVMQGSNIDWSLMTFNSFNSNASLISVETSGAMSNGSLTNHFLGNAKYYFSAKNYGGISLALAVLDIPNAVTVTAFSFLDSGNLYNAPTFTAGSVANVTGARAIITNNSVLYDGGTPCNSFWPGTTACQITNGAQTDAGDALTTPFPAANIPPATATAQGAVFSGCVSYTPVDESGAGLPLTSTGEYCIDGPAGGQKVVVFYSVTYPVTVDASQAAISLPFPVPNQGYAVVKGTPTISATLTNWIPRTVINSNPGVIVFTQVQNNTATTNVLASTATLTGSIQYPLQ